jgi:hypothetical protein
VTIPAKILARHWSRLSDELIPEDESLWFKTCIQFRLFVAFGLLVGAVIGFLLERGV